MNLWVIIFKQYLIQYEYGTVWCHSKLIYSDLKLNDFNYSRSVKKKVNEKSQTRPFSLERHDPYYNFLIAYIQTITRSYWVQAIFATSYTLHDIIYIAYILYRPYDRTFMIWAILNGLHFTYHMWYSPYRMGRMVNWKSKTFSKLSRIQFDSPCKRTRKSIYCTKFSTKLNLTK